MDTNEEIEFRLLYQKFMEKARGKAWKRSRNRIKKIKGQLRSVPAEYLKYYLYRFDPDVIAFCWKCLGEKMPFPYLQLITNRFKSTNAIEQLYAALNSFDYARYPVSVYSTFLNRSYSMEQQIELIQGIEKGILPCEDENWTLYANPKLNVGQMQQIRMGLSVGRLTTAQVRVYADPRISASKMKCIRIGLQQKMQDKDVLLISNIALSSHQIEVIISGLRDSRVHDYVTFYAKPEFSWEQMELIRKAIIKGLSVRQIEALAKPQYSIRAMTNIVDTFVKLNANSSYGERTLGQRSSNSLSKSNINFEQKSTTAKSYFSVQFIDSVKRRNSDIWNSWLQAKQVYNFEDSFAASILADSAAVERVECEVLRRCPYTSCFIEAQEEHGNKLAFFAVLEDNILRFLPTEDETVGQISELKVDQHFTCGEMLTVFDDHAVKDNIMKMLQLYVCLCSAEMEDVQPAGNHTPLSAREPQQTGRRGDNQGVPSWDVNMYTVTMQRTVRKNRRQQQSSSGISAVSHRPHKRRAHWHHYWIGSKDDETSRRQIVKWVSEIDVNPTEDNLPVRIILVKR